MHFPLLRFFIPNQSQLAILVVSLLILFLAYTSQYVFYFIKPGPLTQSQAIWFNLFLLALWFSYFKASFVDAAPKDWCSKDFLVQDGKSRKVSLEHSSRWCRKCQAVKPPRAHHCKTCGIVRVHMLWEERHVPAYLGPSEWALAYLLVLFVTNGVVLFALLILFGRIIYGVFFNTTMIESWEIERHEALVNRCRKSGGFIYAAGGRKIRVEHQEFPYDIGIWKNLCQAMGTKNVFMWLMPFGGGPTIDSAVYWEVNGFEDVDKIWPPPDPDKISYAWHLKDACATREFGGNEDGIAAFKIRQENDLRRRGYKRYHSLEESYDDFSDRQSNNSCEYETGLDGKFGWTNTDEDRLRDYGVDEEEES